MALLIMFAIATIGLTNTLVHGKILDLIGFREYAEKHLPEWFNEMIKCYECTGFWSGVFMALLAYFCMSIPFWWVIPCGFAGSVVSSFYTEVIFYLQGSVSFVVGDQNDKST